MTIYIIMLFSSLVLYTMFPPQKNGISFRIMSKKVLHIDNSVVSSAIVSLPFVFVSGMRYSVGTDYWNSYYSGFYRVLSGNYFDRYPIGFLTIIKGIQFFTDNVFVFFFIVAFLTVSLTFIAIYTESANIPYSIILFFVFRYFFISMNAMRQILAISVMIFSIRYIRRKKFKNFLVCIMIATSLHYSAILMIPYYFLDKIAITKYRFIALCVGFLVTAESLYRILLKLLTDTKYGNHLINYNVSGWKVTLFTIALNVSITVIAYSSYERMKNDARYRFYLNLQIVATLLSFLFRTIPLIERIYWMYSFPIIISLPYFISLTKRRKYRKGIMIGIVMVLAIIYIGFDIMILNDHEVIPYNSILGRTAEYFDKWK